MCIAWPWLFGITPTGWWWSIPVLPIAMLGAAVQFLPSEADSATTAKADWLLLMGFPCSVGICMLLQPEAANRHAFGALALAVAVASLLAYGAACLVALGRPRANLMSRAAAIVPQPWDIPPAPAPRLQLPIVVIGTLGALCIGMWAPRFSAPSVVKNHWGEAAQEGALLTSVVGAALAVVVLAVFVGGGIRTARSAEPGPTRARFAMLITLALILSAMHWITRSP